MSPENEVAMDVSIGETSSVEEGLFTPKTAEEFEQFIQEHLAEHVVPVDPEEVQERLHWRGLTPSEGVGLLTGQIEAVPLRSDKPNTTFNPHKAISFNQSRTDEIQFNLALGF